jgi:hypothetical protein
MKKVHIKADLVVEAQDLESALNDFAAAIKTTVRKLSETPEKETGASGKGWSAAVVPDKK